MCLECGTYIVLFVKLLEFYIVMFIEHSYTVKYRLHCERMMKETLTDFINVWYYMNTVLAFYEIL